MNATPWLPTHVAAIATRPLPVAPLMTAAERRPLLPGTHLWDFWPLQEPDGRVASVAGGELWMVLSAPDGGDPLDRHGRARIRALHHVDGRWRDLGAVLPEDWGPGSREWSGSAVLEPTTGQVTLFYTAAGRAGEARPTYVQRLFQCTGRLTINADGTRLASWSTPAESLASDRAVYHPADQEEGGAGKIKAFRDPASFRDPRDGAAYLLFAASLGGSSSAYNGAVGIARSDRGVLGPWRLLPPILHADGLNNELERPHMLARDGLYYLFWSTQRSVFEPAGPAGPTGLYGMVGAAPLGPFNR